MLKDQLSVNFDGYIPTKRRGAGSIPRGRTECCRKKDTIYGASGYTHACRCSVGQNRLELVFRGPNTEAKPEMQGQCQERHVADRPNRWKHRELRSPRYLYLSSFIIANTKQHDGGANFINVGGGIMAAQEHQMVSGTTSQIVDTADLLIDCTATWNS